MGLFDWLFGKQERSVSQNRQASAKPEPVLSETQIAEMYSQELDTIELLVKCCLQIDHPDVFYIGIIISEPHIYLGIDIRFDNFSYVINPKPDDPPNTKKFMKESRMKKCQLDDDDLDFFLDTVPTVESSYRRGSCRKAGLVYPIRNPNHRAALFHLLTTRLQNIMDNAVCNVNISIDETKYQIGMHD